MNARERIVEKFEISQMAKNGAKSYGTIQLPKKVIVRIESVRGEIESTKQPKIREDVPPEPEEGIGKNGKKIVKRLEEAPIKKMKNSNRVVTEIHTEVPIIYYVMMMFGLASAIFGAFTVRSHPVYYSVMIGGIGVFFVAFISFLEIKYTKRKLKISG